MDIQERRREVPFFSILNDCDIPSFAVRPRQSCTSASKPSTSPSPTPSPRLHRLERPALQRQEQYTRASSVSSFESNTPPLLRYSSSSSKASSTSMDSSPSPITPAFSFNDSTLLPYDPSLNQDVLGYLPSPTTITPYLEQQMLIAQNLLPDPYSKQQLLPTLPPNSQHPLTQAPILNSLQQIPTPESSNPSLPPSAPTSVPPAPSAPLGIHNNPAPNTTGPPPPKKNKYPCPYAQSHRCEATFTTSGHAARHGKKHTGEKGVHCPICNKAFTRKDNMKQHERTHKNSQSGSNSDDSARRSKAAVTKEAQKSKANKKADSTPLTASSRRSSIIRSPLSEMTSSVQTSTEPSLNIEDPFPVVPYADDQTMIMPLATGMPDSLSPNTLYQAMTEAMPDDLVNMAQVPIAQPMLDKSTSMLLGSSVPVMPPLARGLSDLDALAQAAETYNPYCQPPNM